MTNRDKPVTGEAPAQNAKGGEPPSRLVGKLSPEQVAGTAPIPHLGFSQHPFGTPEYAADLAQFVKPPRPTVEAEAPAPGETYRREVDALNRVTDHEIESVPVPAKVRQAHMRFDDDATRASLSPAPGSEKRVTDALGRLTEFSKHLLALVEGRLEDGVQRLTVSKGAAKELADAIAALSLSPPPPAEPKADGGWQPTHRHMTRGSLVKVLFEANGQFVLHNPTDPVYDDKPFIVYEHEDGSRWVRPMDEFYDGRFEEVRPKDTHPPQQPAGEVGKLVERLNKHAGELATFKETSWIAVLETLRAARDAIAPASPEQP